MFQPGNFRAQSVYFYDTHGSLATNLTYKGRQRKANEGRNWKWVVEFAMWWKVEEFGMRVDDRKKIVCAQFRRHLHPTGAQWKWCLSNATHRIRMFPFSPAAERASRERNFANEQVFRVAPDLDGWLCLPRSRWPAKRGKGVWWS